MGGVDAIVLVSTNMPFSRRCLLSLQTVLPLFFTEILQSAMLNRFGLYYNNVYEAMIIVKKIFLFTL